MNWAVITEHVDPPDLETTRLALSIDDDDASALGWAAVRGFEEQHGIVLPEPYRSFVAEVSDGSPAGLRAGWARQGAG